MDTSGNGIAIIGERYPVRRYISNINYIPLLSKCATAIYWRKILTQSIFLFVLMLSAQTG
jgi:hypothetical protein